MQIPRPNKKMTRLPQQVEIESHIVNLVEDSFRDLSNYDNLPIEAKEETEEILSLFAVRVEESLLSIKTLIAKYDLPFTAEGVLVQAMKQCATHCWEADKPVYKPMPEYDIILEKDALLNYCLNNKLSSGKKRGAVLFKMLAAMFVQAGLTDRQIKPYAERIIANCENKNLRELTGWVKWARRRKAKFNPVEANKWIQNNLKR